MGGAPLLCLFEKETGYRLNLRSVYMQVNPLGSSNASHGNGGTVSKRLDQGIRANITGAY